jgi:hypothetical protein
MKRERGTCHCSCFMCRSSAICRRVQRSAQGSYQPVLAVTIIAGVISFARQASGAEITAQS